MTNLPSGVVTFLFTDVEGSTVLWDQHHDAMHQALAEHDRLLLDAFAVNNGYVFSTAGDSFGAAFATANDAIAAATTAQLGLQASTADLQLGIRVGIHTGEATVRDDNYFGIEVNRAARIMAAAHSGQILLSARTAARLGASVDCVDLGEHLLKDLPRPERIFQLNYPGLETHFDKIKAVADPSSALPIRLTRFVGREVELTEVNRLLTESRLVTLTGSGGAGKTRLALQVASDAHYQFPDGLRMVELAGVSEEDVLIDEVAQVFGVKAVADTPMVDALVAGIGVQKGLLILDNCEHLVDVVRRLVTTIVSTCPNLRILCTSRMLLDVAGEVVFRVPSLSVPSSDTDLANASLYDAVRLFLDRAQLSNPDFELTDATVAEVIAICTRLDGIPLALELAAARLRVMSPAQIATRLDERFLSVATESAAGSRHHTLQNAIEWGYDLLTEREQQLFQRLSVFTGDFTLEAAEYIGAGEPLDDVDLTEVLFDLVDKSMVSPEHGSEGTTRYRLLESVRNYGLRLLEDSDSVAVRRTTHLQYYTEYCESLQETQRGGKLGQALARLDENEDNIRAALRFGLTNRQDELVARTIGAIGYLWYSAGLYREGIEWCAELLDASPDLPDDVWAAVLHAYGTLLGSWEQPRAGATMLEQEVELRRRLADPARLAAALNNLGNLQHDIGRSAEAEASLREAIEQFRLAGQSPNLALTSLGSGHLHAGDLVAASALYNEALEEALLADDTYGVALATSHLGQCAALRGDFVTGRELLTEARSRFDALTVKPGVANSDYHLARIDNGENLPVAAARRLLAALATPEAHWYLATQYWILQTVASMIADKHAASTMVGAVQAHYDRSDEVQPAYVLDDLQRTKQDLQQQIGTNDFERQLARGHRTPIHEVLGLAVAELEHLIADNASSDA